MSADAPEVARAYLESFATGDPDAVAAHVAADFVNDHASALGSGCVGRDEYRRRVPGFFDGFPGLRYEVEAVIGDGPVVAVPYRLIASPPEGAVELRGVMVIEVRDGLVAHRTDYWDSLTYLRQTGQSPAG